MTREELLHLIAQGEGQRLEFKRSLAELEDSVCTIAAFANAEACPELVEGAARCSLACGPTGQWSV